MNVWFDSLRSPPGGWVAATSYDEAVTLFTGNTILDASLDYIVGYGASYGDPPAGIPGQSPIASGPTGLDLLVWISENNKWPTHSLAIHAGDNAAMVAYVKAHGSYNETLQAHIECGGQFGYVAATVFIMKPSEFLPITTIV